MYLQSSSHTSSHPSSSDMFAFPSSSPSSSSSSAPLAQMYSAYIRWRAHDKEKVRTRPGLDVSLDTRLEAVQAAGGPLAVELGEKGDW